jgi:hypothetical protein
MSSLRGFTNLKLVNDSIRFLFLSLKPERIRGFQSTLSHCDMPGKDWSDPVLDAQAVAKAIASHFLLDVSAVVVTFRSDLKVPGRVELSQSSEFFIEIHSEHRDEPHCVAAILAHEIAHIFLHRNRIRLEQTFENEVLTDTAAAYLGCGVLILNGATTTVRKVDSRTMRTQSRRFGYLTIDEFGYVVAKRDSLFGQGSAYLLNTDLAQAGYHEGSLMLDQERRVRPLVRRPFHERFRYWFAGKGPDQTTDDVITFGCPHCSQRLRIRLARKKHLVRCAMCDSRFWCYS